MSELTVGKITPLSVGPGISSTSAPIRIKDGYSLVKDDEINELRERSKDLEWLLEYLNKEVTDGSLDEFWMACCPEDECTGVGPVADGITAIRSLRGAK